MSLTQWKTCSTTLRAADLAASATRSSSPTCERLLATTRGEPSLRDGPEGRGDHGLYDPAAPGQVAKLARGRGVGDLEGRHANEGAHRRRVPDLVLALAVGEAEAGPRHATCMHEVADPRPAHRGVGPPRPGVSAAGLPREGEPGVPGAGLGGAVGEPGAPGPRASVPCPSRRQRMRTVSCGYPRPRRHRPQIILYPQVGGMDGQRSALSRASRRDFIIAFLDAVAYISFSEIQIAYFSP